LRILSFLLCVIGSVSWGSKTGERLKGLLEPAGFKFSGTQIYFLDFGNEGLYWGTEAGLFELDLKSKKLHIASTENSGKSNSEPINQNFVEPTADQFETLYERFLSEKKKTSLDQPRSISVDYAFQSQKANPWKLTRTQVAAELDFDGTTRHFTRITQTQFDRFYTLFQANEIPVIRQFRKLRNLFSLNGVKSDEIISIDIPESRPVADYRVFQGKPGHMIELETGKDLLGIESRGETLIIILKNGNELFIPARHNGRYLSQATYRIFPSGPIYNLSPLDQTDSGLVDSLKIQGLGASDLRRSPVDLVINPLRLEVLFNPPDSDHKLFQSRFFEPKTVYSDCVMQVGRISSIGRYR